jgi:hypothetical protein
MTRSSTAQVTAPEVNNAGALGNDPGMSLAGPLTGQAVSGMKATRARSAAFAWNGRRPDATLPVRVFRWVRGHCQVEQSDQDLRRSVLVNPQVICDA